MVEDHLSNSVTRLKPKSEPYEVALNYFRRGDFHSCSDALNGAGDFVSTVLRCRALIRLGAAHAVPEILTEYTPGMGSASCAEHHLVLASAHLVLKDFDATDRCLTEARAFAFSSGVPALEAEAIYLSGLLAMAERDLAAAAADVRRILELESRLHPFAAQDVPSKYPFRLEYWRGRAFELQSKIEAALGDRDSEATSIKAAFSEFDRGAVEDAFVESSMLLNASFIVRDIGSTPLGDFVIDRAEKFAWNSSLRFFECFVFHAFGVRRAYQGDHISALRAFRRSAEVAPSVPLRLLATVNRCRLMRDVGETITASEEFDYALRLASQVNWNDVNVQERDALLTLAQLIAPTDVIRARAMFDRFENTKARAWSVDQINDAKRWRAYSRYTEAQILLAEGDGDRAIVNLTEAFEIWSEVGDERQRATSACELAELTHDDRFILVAVAEAQRFPNSFVARRIRIVCEGLLQITEA